MTLRIGIGYDLHLLDAEGTFLVLGGVRIPHDRGFVAHSDGDVLVHAIIDAMLGAAGLGNIGQRFPDTDPNLKGADSLVLLERTKRLVQSADFSVVNIDSVIIAEEPKLTPHVDAMRQRLAEVLGIERGRISIKPKTNETVGAEGRGEAVSAQAVVLLEER
jgi:2-C-methyl-D-erythritol 2,4-cyclodiphosphate synthase